MIVIVGAGIAGLTLANALEQRGVDYLVVESSPSVRTEGAGLVLHHNALSILEALGLADSLAGAVLSSMQIVAGNGRQVMPFAASGTARAIAVHRQELMRVLLLKLPPERISCRAQIHSVQSEGAQLQLISSQESMTASVVVVANGAGSDLHGTPVKRSSGQWCWRTVVPSEDSPQFGAEYWFGQHRLGVIPIGGQRAYVFHVMHKADEDNCSEHLHWLQAQQAQGNFTHLDFRRAQWLSHPLEERKIDWGQSNQVAIGDAAHAMTPNMGMGAAMAMEDAWTLAKMLQQTSNSSALAGQLAAKRQKRVHAIQRQSWQIGQVAHWRFGPLTTVRNLALRCMPQAVAAYQLQRLTSEFNPEM